jgi:hypothetical protein
MAISRRFLQPINLLNAASDPSTAIQGDIYYNTSLDSIKYYDGSQWNEIAAGTSISVSESAPTATDIGEGWFKSSTSELFIWDGTYWVEATSTIQGETLPDQEGNSGKFLSTDGSDTSWQTVDALPDQTGNSGKYLTTDGYIASWDDVDAATLDGQSGSYYTGYADTAESDAISSANAYSDSLATNYDSSGSATTAESNANSYTDSAISTHNADTTGVHGIADTSLLATKTYADSAASTAAANLIDSAPSTLDTLNELASALGDDPNFATTVSTALGNKQPLDADLTSIAGLSGTSGLLKKTAANTWSLDTSSYLTGNQTITLSGDVSGSGTTSISVTVADDSHNHIIGNVDGLQTALDAKLASSSYTASDVLTKIKTVDGSGSGLDTDLLDGQHGSYYATDSAVVHLAGTETITGTKTVSSELRLTHTGAGQARMVTGNYGVIFRNDGSSMYMLVTASGDQYGSWNSLRPFAFNVATGLVTMSNGVSITGNSSLTGNLSINGTLSATTKSFDIEHPTKENMRLRYGSLEGPENGVYVRGKSSSSTITLPDYWTGLVDPDSITVQVTPIGKHKNLYVKEISDNTVTIGGVRGEFEFFYFIQAERIDVDKLVVEYGS